MKENITGLNISMHNIVLHKHPESFKKIFKIPNSFFFTQIPTILNQILKCASIAELIHKIHIIGCLQDLNESHNMSSILNFGKSLDLIDGEFLKPWTHLIFFDFDDLDCHSLISFFISSFVYLAKLSLADDLFKTIIFYFFSHSAVRFTIYMMCKLTV